MNFSGVRCDECARIKEAANHWHRIGVFRDNGRVNVEIGDLRGPRIGEEKFYEVLDLCGDQCFYKTLGKLLKINPASVEQDA